MRFKRLLFSVLLCLNALFAGMNANATTCPNATALTTSLPIWNQAIACGGANDITAGNVTTTCGDPFAYSGSEALYTYTPTANQTISISYNGGNNGNFSSIFVFKGCPTTSGTICMGTAKANYTYNANLTVTLVAGNTYYIMFDTELSPGSPCPGTFSITSCQPPTSLNINSFTQTTANLSFAGSASNYQVGWSASSQGGTNITSAFTNTNSYSLTGLTQSTNYLLRVRSICAAGDTSLWSVYTEFTTSGACGTPVTVTTTAITATGVTLNWVASPMGNANGYQYEIRSYGAAGSGNIGRTAFGTTASGITTATAGGLTPNTEYKVYVRANCGATGYSNWMSATPFTTPPTCFSPIAVAVDTINSAGVTFSWTAPATAPPNGYRYEVRTLGAGGSGNTGLAASGVTGSGVTTVTVAGLAPTAVYTFYVQGNCGTPNFSPWTAGTIFSFPCTAPMLTSTNAATRCGLGAVSLTATGTGNALYWYADTMAAAPVVAIGSPFTTPVIGATTPYYVAAVDTVNYTGLGNTSIPGTGNAYFERGIVLRTSQDFRLNTAQFYSTVTTGTIAGMARLVDDSTGSILTTTNFSFPAGGTAQWYTMNLNWNLVAGKTYRLLATFTSGSVSRHTSYTPSYNSPAYTNLGVVGKIISGYDIGAYPSPYTYDYNYFHNLSITSVCASARTAVVATVTPPPAITASASANAVCLGSPVTLTVSSANAGYSYSWLPATNPAAGTTVLVAPATTTKYFVSAIDNSTGANAGCTAGDSVTVTVNFAPTAPSVSPLAVTALCLGDTISIALTGSEEARYQPVPLFSEDFNGTSTALVSSDLGSTTTNASAGLWSVKPTGYSYINTPFASPTGTPFVLANANAGGFGTTHVALTSPVINTGSAAKLALTYKHHYSTHMSDSALIEASTDNGVTWVTVKDVNAGVQLGTPTDFVTDTVLLNNFTGSANMKFRFRYRSFYGLFWALDDVKLISKGAVSLFWMATPASGAGLPAGAGLPNTANTTIRPVPTAPGTYTYTASLISGANTCSRMVNIAAVIVGAKPVVNLGSDTSICAGRTITLNAGNPGSTFLWSTGNTTRTIGVANPNTYFVKVTSAGGCIGRDTIKISWKQIPVAGTITITNQSPAFTFTATGNQNDSQRGWLFGDGTGNATGNSTTASHTYTTNGTFIVKFYALNDCGTDTTSATITVSNVGIQNVLLAGEVELFPNPAATYFTVQNSSAQKLKTITVLNVVGAVVQEVKADNPKEQRIAIEGLAAGSYLVRITLDGTTVIRRLQITQ